MKKIVLASVALVVLVAVWIALFVTFRSTEQVLFPGGSYQVYPVTDSTVGGFSTVELSQSDSVISARVNIRSGMAYPYAGMGVNLLSVNNRPASGFFDFSDYDSLVIDAETNRMRKIGVKITRRKDEVHIRKPVLCLLRPVIPQCLIFMVSNQEDLHSASSLFVFSTPLYLTVSCASSVSEAMTGISPMTFSLSQSIIMISLLVSGGSSCVLTIPS